MGDVQREQAEQPVDDREKEQGEGVLQSVARAVGSALGTVASVAGNVVSPLADAISPEKTTNEEPIAPARQSTPTQTPQRSAPPKLAAAKPAVQTPTSRSRPAAKAAAANTV